jgi:hypothetical protein
MRRPVAAIALAAGGLAVAPAGALAALDVAVQPNEARYGQAHHVEGRYTDANGAPLGERRITVEARDYPFTGEFRPVGHATTGADGTYSLDDVELARNADIRVVAFDGTTSGIARAFTYPAFSLRYTPAGGNRIRLTQTYRTPRDVRLRAPTLFYLGSGGASRSSKRITARTRRTAAGRFRATATVRLPKAWNGRFKYASCFGYSKDSGMGDPARGCTKRFSF